VTGNTLKGRIVENPLDNQRFLGYNPFQILCTRSLGQHGRRKVLVFERFPWAVINCKAKPEEVGQ
jgi:hypothetical protein